MAPRSPAAFDEALAVLLARRLADGGFAETDGGDFRADATAWAFFCLTSRQVQADAVAAARARLAAAQLADGRIPLSPDYPEVIWPTALAAMALHGDRTWEAHHARAIGFLLATSGRESPREKDSPLGHDTSLLGWPWTVDTHAWVEPTAMAVRALALAGHSAHPRVQSGIRLLLDRQLPEGGWNYGNTTVYGKTLNAMPAASGIALWALAGHVSRDRVAPTLAFLDSELPRIHTPLSLGWALHGLIAWGKTMNGLEALVEDCLRHRQRFGPYGTSQLAVLLTAATASPPGGLPNE